MTEKEFHKLKAEDLVAILMAQNEEVLRLGYELDNKKEVLASLTEKNNRIKDNLDKKDAETEMLKDRLNKRDARIRELEEENMTLHSDVWIGLEEIGSIAEAARGLAALFARVQEDAKIYLNELMEEVRPKPAIAMQSTEKRVQEKLVWEPGTVEDDGGDEESIEDIERRYLGYAENELTGYEDIEEIEKRYIE